jgi:AbrB family looped-hinge helix DNA binding protein
MHHKGDLPLPLVKVKEKFQITLPAEVRRMLHLAVGDLLEATVERDKIVLKPKAVIDRAWQQMTEAMASVEDCAPNSQQSPREQEEEIARIVKDFRKKHYAERRA